MPIFTQLRSSHDTAVELGQLTTLINYQNICTNLATKLYRGQMITERKKREMYNTREDELYMYI